MQNLYTSPEPKVKQKLIPSRRCIMKFYLQMGRSLWNVSEDTCRLHHKLSSVLAPWNFRRVPVVKPKVSILHRHWKSEQLKEISYFST
jgi:hypothetical protein